MEAAKQEGIEIKDKDRNEFVVLAGPFTGKAEKLLMQIAEQGVVVEACEEIRGALKDPRES